jgi:hypothetical protein
MDEALFARRALGGAGGRARPNKATIASVDSSKQAKKDEEERKAEYKPTPDEMIEMMKFLRDTGLAEGTPDVPEKIEVRFA